MAVRSYDQDVVDVTAVQAGDSQAWLSIQAVYAPTVRRVARKYNEVLSVEDATEIAWGFIAEHVLTMELESAKFLRNQIALLASEAIDQHLFPEIPKRSLVRLRHAEALMGAPDGSWALSSGVSTADAAAAAGTSVGAMLAYQGLSGMGSIDQMLDDSYDDDNPYGWDAAGGFTSDEVTPFDPELSNVKMTSAITDVVDADKSQATSAKQAVRDIVQGLSPRQQQVINLFCEGMNDTEIAAELGISSKAVNTTRLRAFESIRSSITL